MGLTAAHLPIFKTPAFRRNPSTKSSKLAAFVEAIAGQPFHNPLIIIHYSFWHAFCSVVLQMPAAKKFLATSNKIKKEIEIMKKVLTGGMIALMVLFLSAGLGLAGNANGQGAGDGTGPLNDILSGEDFTYSGVVMEILADGGFVITTDNGNVTIYGIGPIKFWESISITRPAVGDLVTVFGYTVDYDGVDRNIAFTIEVGEDTVQLRDFETGLPLWRKAGWGKTE